MQIPLAHELVQLLQFGGAGFVGMVFGYYRRWAWQAEGVSLYRYMFGDSHAIGRAITTLLMLCAGAGGLQYLEALDTSQIILAGAGLGLLVPETVDKKRSEIDELPERNQ